MELGTGDKKAVAGDAVSGAFFPFCIRIFNGRKIAPVKILRSFKASDCLENVFMWLAKYFGDLETGGDGFAD